jgi:Domain of unknown function (DUF5979)
MKRWIGAIVAAAALVALTAIPVAAGGNGAAPLTVDKVVIGPVPAGTQFVVTIQCDSEIINNGGGMGASSAQLVFDAQGNPVGPDTVTFNDGGQCTVTETQNGGASSVIYECESTVPPPAKGALPDAAGRFGPRPAQPPLPRDDVCESNGPQSEPITVFIEFEDQEVTVTVTNTFEAAPAPQQPAPAVAVEEAPIFTG